MKVVEIRAYNLQPGARAEFHRLFVSESLPLLQRFQVDVVAYGSSLDDDDDDNFFLIRAFPNRAERARSEAAFYGSAEWRDGPREKILALIDSYTTIVLELGPAAVAELRAIMKQ